MVPENMNSDQVPKLDNFEKQELQSDTVYEVRVCALNSCGMGPWSQTYEFKTLKKFEIDAENCTKVSILKTLGGIHLNWNLINPRNVTGNFSFVILMLKDNPGGAPFFDEIYSGEENECSILTETLQTAHYFSENNKLAVLFRIQTLCNFVIIYNADVKWFPKD